MGQRDDQCVVIRLTECPPGVIRRCFQHGESGTRVASSKQGTPKIPSAVNQQQQVAGTPGFEVFE
jgi:hypothetical protein